jgi:hypothetical protein
MLKLALLPSSHSLVFLWTRTNSNSTQAPPSSSLVTVACRGTRHDKHNEFKTQSRGRPEVGKQANGQGNTTTVLH